MSRFIEDAETALKAAEAQRRESSVTDATVDYHLRRAEVFAQLAQAEAAEKSAHATQRATRR